MRGRPPCIALYLIVKPKYFPSSYLTLNLKRIKRCSKVIAPGRLTCLTTSHRVSSCTDTLFDVVLLLVRVCGLFERRERMGRYEMSVLGSYRPLFYDCGRRCVTCTYRFLLSCCCCLFLGLCWGLVAGGGGGGLADLSCHSLRCTHDCLACTVSVNINGSSTWESQSSFISRARCCLRLRPPSPDPISQPPPDVFTKIILTQAQRENPSKRSTLTQHQST